MNGFLEVGSSIFLLPWVMVRRASRLRELLRQCAGLSCRSALRVKDHERGHRQDYYKPPQPSEHPPGYRNPRHARLFFMRVE